MEKDYTWAVSLIGGILALIAFFTPAVSIEAYDGSIYLWIWGLISYEIYNEYYEIYDSDTTFIDNPDVLIPSIVCSIFLVLCILILIGTSLNYRSRIKEGIGNPNPWLVSSLLIIAFTIAWIIAMDISWEVYPDFWDYFDPNFGVIGPFLGSGLAIVGFIAAKVSQKQKREVIFVPKAISSPAAKAEPYSTLLMDPTIKINFCPECGQKLISETQRFCMNCGFKFHS
ncbi:MAG: zinc ribbon domain-containing protein, partial [Promethearchaeota archaeon]